MSRSLCPVFLATLAVAVGCAVTDYPVITDSAGPYESVVVDSHYDKAYVKPFFQFCQIGPDGCHGIFTLIAQDWQGDRRISTYDNFDPTSTVLFLDQTYCDPTRQADCALIVADDRDDPDDDIFDYEGFPECSGFDYLGSLMAVGSRIGECGSGFNIDSQELATTIADLSIVDYRGRPVYDVPVNSATTKVNLTSVTGASESLPLFGTHAVYLDSRMRLLHEQSAAWDYQLEALETWSQRNGPEMQMQITYGGLQTSLHLKLLK